MCCSIIIVIVIIFIIYYFFLLSVTRRMLARTKCLGYLIKNFKLLLQDIYINSN